MSDPGKRALPVLSQRVTLPPPREVVQPEPMLRYACNQKGCCCRGWQIPFTLDDFLRLYEHVDEPERSELAQGLELKVDTPDGVPAPEGTSKEAVLHSLRLGTVGDDDQCRFVEGQGGCKVHRTKGLYALPDLCVNFPAAGFRTADNDAVELWWDPVCPEVLRSLDESDAPLTLHRAPPPPVPLDDPENPPHSPEDGTALRVHNAFEGFSPRIDKRVLSRAELEHVRGECLNALHHPTRPAWRSLHAIAEAFRTVDAERPLDFRPEEPADAQPFLRHLWNLVGAHGANVLTSALLRYRRFIHAVDLTALIADPEPLRAALEHWPDAFEKHLANQEDALRPLVLRHLSHHFAMPWVNQDGELRSSADTVIFIYATAQRFAAALGQALGRDVDRPLYQVAIGCSEHFWRGTHVPAELVPWFCSPRSGAWFKEEAAK